MKWLYPYEKVRVEDIRSLAAKSLVDCHVPGVDSVVISNVDGKLIRAYIAHTDHQMWKNQFTVEFTHPMSLAVHAHRQDIHIRTCFGNVFNIVENHIFGTPVALTEYKYSSQIVANEMANDANKGGFEWTGKHRRFKLIMLQLGLYDMKAADVHSMYVPKNEQAAWFVYEAAADETYESVAYSNTDLTLARFDDLYKPMSVDRYLYNLHLLKVVVI